MADGPLAPPGSGDFGEEKEPSEVPAWFMQYLQAALKSPLLSVPKPFETWMIDKVGSSGFDVPISQIVGFAGFTFQFAPAAASSVSTTSTSFVSLTGGPEFTGLPDGRYLFMWGAVVSASAAGAIPRMGIKINATEATNAESCFHNTADSFTLMFAAGDKTLNNGGNNTVTCRYKVNSGTGSWEARWLLGVKYDNL